MTANRAEFSTCALQSGSNGNCFYVETPDVRLLFDAGISGRAARGRLAQHGRDIAEVDALILSHNHTDHTRGAGVFHRLFSLDVYMTPRVWQATRDQIGAIDPQRLHHFDPGQSLQFGNTEVLTVPTAHDGYDGVAFIVRSRGKNLGIFTDLGHRFTGIEECISPLHLIYLESNYDPQMLAAGSYPPWLKQRISGDKGHLANHEAGELARDAGGSLQRLVLSHLSEHNNDPQIALNTVRQHVPADLSVSIAPRYDTTEMFIIT